MRIRHLLAITLFHAFIATGLASAAAPIGKTVGASTTVSASGRTLSTASPLFLNDVLKSNSTGLGQFIFDDGTKLAMGPSASLTIDRSIYKGKSALRAGIQATRGAFRYISGATSGHSVITPYGTIGIRGTAFDFTIRNGKVHILLFRGAVTFCSGGSCKTLKRSCDYLSGGGGSVSDPQPLSQGLGSGLNVGQVFPLAVDQNRLAAPFRQGGKTCLSRAARRNNGTIQGSVPGHKSSLASAGAPAAPGTPDDPPGTPGPTGKSNKGFGNGGEGDDNGPNEAHNPGHGGGKGRN